MQPKLLAQKLRAWLAIAILKLYASPKCH